MDMRLPIGTAAVALLLLPLGYQLYTSTAMSPADRLAHDAGTTVTSQPAEAKGVAVPATPATPPRAEITLPLAQEDAADLVELAPPPPAPITSNPANRMQTMAPAGG
ncbi:MAG TPA: hypothetical protein VL147_11460, partial [Devosia sp.]|nr:hypothetical protein [Devosia sp.]